MKAIVQNYYGGVDQLHLEDIETPTVKSKDVLVKVKACNIASGDMRINTLSVPGPLKVIMKLIFGWNGPRNKVRGISGSGEITEVGNAVTKFKVGDRVYFINSMKAGCMAEYVLLNDKSKMVIMPEEMSFTEAAPIAFGAMSAYHFINKDTIKKNDKVLVYGASGSVGSFGLQLAKYYGAHVTGVSSARNHEVLKELGCDEVYDYREQNISELNKEYDVIFDAVGKINKSFVEPILKKDGKYLSIKKPTAEKVDRLLALNKIYQEKGFISYIDKVYSFDAFKDAHQHVYDGHKVGNVVMSLEEN